MVLNETLQKHQDCLDQCERDYVACETEEENQSECEEKIYQCECTCDFDYGP